MLLPLAGYGLKCYKCDSGKGWDDCATNQEESPCKSDEDRCGKVHYDAKQESVSRVRYLKGCTTSKFCKETTDSNCRNIFGGEPSIEISKCEPNCCSGDLCNGAKVPMVSAIILIACALVALFR